MNERTVYLPNLIRNEQQAKRKLAFLQKGKDISLEALKQKPQEWWKNVVCEPKIDGIRAVYYDGELISFAQKKIYNCGQIVEELHNIVNSNEVLDGELYGDSWEHTQSVTMSSKTVKPLNDIKFHVFDLIQKSEFESGVGLMLQRKRHSFLQDFYVRGISNRISYVHKYVLSSFKQFKQQYDHFLELGYEGAMIKQLNEPYLFYKGDAWLKCKHTETADVTIVGLKRGTGKYKDTLGSFNCIDEQGKPISVSGMSDILRNAVWKKLVESRGRVIEVKFFKRTQAGNMYSAHFLRWRDDK